MQVGNATLLGRVLNAFIYQEHKVISMVLSIKLWFSKNSMAIANLRWSKICYKCKSAGMCLISMCKYIYTYNLYVCKYFNDDMSLFQNQYEAKYFSAK